MKRILLLQLLVGMTLLTYGQTKTIYLNSKTISCNVKGLKKECLQYKNQESDTTWNIYTGKILGFIYNPGYFYTLEVQPVGKTDPPTWKLVKTIQKTRSTFQQEPGDTTSQLVSPPAALVGQWNFSRFPADAAVRFTKEFLHFDAREMRVNGRASCNGFFGNYTADSTGGAKTIHFEAIGHTMMACEALATENKLLEAMKRVDNWQVKGRKLYLRSGNRTIIELTRSVTGGTI